jgi:hypothetical protein
MANLTLMFPFTKGWPVMSEPGNSTAVGAKMTAWYEMPFWAFAATDANNRTSSSNFFISIEQINEGLFRGYFKAKTKGRWNEIQRR